MNPATATMRSTEICNVLGVSDQSVYRWLSDPYPSHHFSEEEPRGKTYALPEIVARLRERRHRGLTGDELARAVAHDSETRAACSSDFLWLGEGAQDRAALFYAYLDGEETERARDCMKAIRRAAVASGLPGVQRLGQIALVHPGVVRFILTGEAHELPVNDAGWRAFATALWVVNPPKHFEVAA